LPRKRTSLSDRPPVVDIDIPKLPGYLVAAVDDWLQGEREARRELKTAAPLLALVCWLHDRGHFFPRRVAIGAALNTSKYSIDSALGTAIANGEVTESYATVPGNVNNRASVMRHRYIIPSQPLLRAYHQALNQHERRRA
jgi:hypothetical protein